MTMSDGADTDVLDHTDGTGQPRTEGDLAAPEGAADDAAAAQPVLADDDDGGGGHGGGDDGDGGGDDPGDGGDDDDAFPDDDPDPPDAIATITENLFLADAMRGVATATEDLYSDAPDKVKAAKDIVDAYRAAWQADPPGELRTKFNLADQNFVRTAGEMEGRFDAWLARLLADDGALDVVLGQRRQVGFRLAATRGERESDRDDAKAQAAYLAARFDDWKDPAKKIAALIGEYADKIDRLNIDIGRGVKPDLAMFSFWFEIAPKHLQIRPDALPPPVAAMATKLHDALEDLAPDVARLFLVGPQREDGRLYLIAADDLAEHRGDVLEAWTDAARAQAEAEAAFKLRPDDAAALKPRWDKLKDDGWVKDAKTRLETTGA